MQRKPIPAHRGSRSTSDLEKRILQPCPAPLLSASASPSSLRTGAALPLGSGCRVTGRWRPAIPIARGTGASLGTSCSHVCSRCRQTLPTLEPGWALRAQALGKNEPGRSPRPAATRSDQARHLGKQRPVLRGASRPLCAGTAGAVETFRQFDRMEQPVAGHGKRISQPSEGRRIDGTPTRVPCLKVRVGTAC